jgi:hypothetical protein
MPAAPTTDGGTAVRAARQHARTGRNLGRRAPAGGGHPRQRRTTIRWRIVERLLVAAIAALVLTAALSSMGGTYA